MNVDTRVRRKHNQWCPVCDGHGGWDARNYKVRFREEGDNSETYTQCIYCGLSNVVAKVVPREEK